MLHCGSANPLRSEIDQKLQAGLTEEQIVDDFVGKYGKVILAAPTGEGFDLVAWTLPVVLSWQGSWCSIEFSGCGPGASRSWLRLQPTRRPFRRSIETAWKRS